MVTCQSANQLKTPAKFSWAFKMVSQFGSLGYTIRGRLLIWQLSRRQSLTPFTRRVSHNIHYQRSWLFTECCIKHVNRKLSGRKKCGRKRCTTNERTAALWGLSNKIDSRIWVNFTRNGLRLGSRHQEPPHTDMSRNLATVVVRGVFPGLRIRRTVLLPSGPKSSFQIEQVLYFIWKPRSYSLEEGWRSS